MALTYISKTIMTEAFGEAELIQLTDRDHATAIVDAVLDRAMLVAEAEVNSYLGATYALPLTSVSDSLRSFACDIARYYLYDNAPTDIVKERYTRAISWLRDVSKGVVSLGLDSTVDQPDNSTTVVLSRTQVFSPTTFSKMGPKW